MSVSHGASPSFSKYVSSQETMSTTAPVVDIVQQFFGKRLGSTAVGIASIAKEDEQKRENRLSASDTTSTSFKTLLSWHSRTWQTVVVLILSLVVIVSVCAILAWFEHMSNQAKPGETSNAQNFTHSASSASHEETNPAGRDANSTHSSARVILFYIVVLVVFVVCVTLLSDLREGSVSERVPARDVTQRLLASIPEDSDTHTILSTEAKLEQRSERVQITMYGFLESRL
eukprot:TRINITY_DN55236_c0_g1_i1.p1 TRINITY_DN55236_c0_g1~~TRINITY_DN55236_c0_g1_i1.p1  ORF type:complete len:230 (-),score=16.30 TRINITY_DN55236_c0_g1_i1:427-1116(-)